MFWNVTSAMLEGMATTVELFALTLLFSLPLGLLVAFGSMSKWAPLRFLSQVSWVPRRLKGLAGVRPIKLIVDMIVWVIRGTPLMLQLMIIYFGPGLILDNNIWGSGNSGRFIATVAAFVLNYSCYFSEIYRGGIQGVPVGQQEAGLVLGMTKSQVFFKVTLLQIIKRIVPPMGNEFITLVKDTALVRVISVYEITWMGETYIRKGMIWPLFYTAVFYLAVNGILTLLLGWLEKKMDYFK